MSRIVHFDLPADDPERLMNFYREAFGWKFSRYAEMEYWFVETGGKDVPGINGAIMKRRDPQQPLTNSIGVENMDRAIQTLEKHGGVMVVPKTAVPAMGYFAFFKDPENNIVGLWCEDKSARP